VRKNLHKWAPPSAYRDVARGAGYSIDGGRHSECGGDRWRVLDWSLMSQPYRSERIMRVLQPEVLFQQSPATGTSSFYGHQRTPYMLPLAAESKARRDARLWCQGDRDCPGFGMRYPDVEMVSTRLKDVWIESPPTKNELLLLHSDCFLHIMSKTQVQPTAISPPSVEELRGIGSPGKQQLLIVPTAVFLHWMHGYYQFVGEMLPKLLVLREKGIIGPGSNRPIILRSSPYAHEFLPLLNMTNDDVLWYDSDKYIYLVQDLYVQDFVTPPHLDLPAPDRLSVAPLKLWQRVREVRL
jgi:hypothetical protein